MEMLRVPINLDEMDEFGLFHLIRNVYVNLKPYYEERASFIKHYDDEYMIDCIVIYILSFNIINGSFDETLNQAKSCKDRDMGRIMMYQFARSAIDRWLTCLNDYETKTIVSVKRFYPKYQQKMLKQFADTPQIRKFIKKNFNPNIDKAVRTYYLSHDLDIDKIGLNLDGEELYEATKRHIYRGLRYTANLYFPQKFMKAYKTKKYIQGLDSEQSKAAVTEICEATNNHLYTLDEYEEEYKVNVGIVKAIFDCQKKQKQREKTPEK